MRPTLPAGGVRAFLLPWLLVTTHGTGYYVSTRGSDSNPGTAAQPFQTITHAYSLVIPAGTNALTVTLAAIADLPNDGPETAVISVAPDTTCAVHETN